MAEHDEKHESADPSRREFATKLIATAGMIAAAALAGEVGGEEAQAQGLQGLDTARLAVFKFHKLGTGFRMTVQGAQVGEGLRQMGLLAREADPSKAKITIEFSA
jgi:hypothetical protein